MKDIKKTRMNKKNNAPNFRKNIIGLLLLWSCSYWSCYSQDKDHVLGQSQLNSPGINIYHLNSGHYFSDKQNVLVVKLEDSSIDDYILDIAWSDTVLMKTSRFAKDANAIIALNGSFFDVEKGGSVAYLESDGQVISRNRNPTEKWAKTDSLLNGAIVLDTSGHLKIEAAKSELFYEQSHSEKAVLFSGPILLVAGEKVKLENSAFVHKRHPRSCLCITDDNSILFIAIDGRNENALGLSLEETQRLLLSLDCKNAINLDGGGSTTLWANDGKMESILNNPSDKEGERPVSNIILIRK
jgi:exopolysaccharide biosynthesis protein